MCKENDKYLIVSRKRRGVLKETKSLRASCLSLDLAFS